uniref:hypothetical protein n=1 Tax=Gemmiger formicilis TaxID=745368 RepID=UPI0040295121
NLNLARLPVPPHPHILFAVGLGPDDVYYYSQTANKCQAFSAKNAKLFYIFVNMRKNFVKTSKRAAPKLAFAP